MSRLYLFGTVGCHLCEAAEALLRGWLNEHALPCRLETVDIALSEERMARYGARIPVLRIKETGAELDWPFGAKELGQFMSGAPDEAALGDAK